MMMWFASCDNSVQRLESFGGAHTACAALVSGKATPEDGPRRGFISAPSGYRNIEIRPPTSMPSTLVA
jgi:hypothetical protein